VTSVEGISEYVLGNGMHVLLFPDPSKDTVTVNVTYLVGSRMEGYGETGMAHLLEHMLFKGSPKHPKVWEELQKRGAANNASTWYDRTNYFETMPAKDDNLAWALEIEADRMLNANVAQADLDKEFSVVRNEFEIGENEPDAVLSERMWSTAYLWHNYGKSTIGSRADIEKVPATSLRRFYKKYYRPDNAVLIITGKFEAGAALAHVARSFGGLANPPAPLERTYTTEPVQDGERVVTLRRTGDVQVVGLAYHVSAAADPEFPAVEAIGQILTDEPSGRLYVALVKTGLATSVSANVLPLHDPGVLELSATVPAGKSIDVVRDKMIAIVEGFARSKITDEEIARFKAQSKKQFKLSFTKQRVARHRAVGVHRGRRLAPPVPASRSRGRADHHRGPEGRGGVPGVVEPHARHVPADQDPRARAAEGHARRRQAGRRVQGRAARGRGREVRGHARQHREAHLSLDARLGHEARHPGQADPRPHRARTAHAAVRNRGRLHRQPPRDLDARPGHVARHQAPHVPAAQGSVGYARGPGRLRLAAGRARRQHPDHAR
jgi:predicted Zn-dependent peptidase